MTYDLKEDDIKIMVALADEDKDEMIPWREFIPIAIEIIRLIYRRNFAGQNKKIDTGVLKAIYN